MFVVAGLFWTCYTVASRYWSVGPLQGITIVSVFSVMLLYVPAYFFFAEPGIGAAPNGIYLGSSILNVGWVSVFA